VVLKKKVRRAVVMASIANGTPIPEWVPQDDVLLQNHYVQPLEKIVV
jgi:hypothetical protein